MIEDTPPNISRLKLRLPLFKIRSREHLLVVYIFAVCWTKWAPQKKTSPDLVLRIFFHLLDEMGPMIKYLQVWVHKNNTVEIDL